MQLKTDQPSLYEQDFALWLDQTAARLKARDVDNLDWENLIEEIEALGISQKHEVESRLKTILAHILKRCYVPLPDCFRGWQVTIRTQRNDLKRLLKKAPSLANHLAAEFDEIYQEALSEVQEEYPEIPFPESWEFERDIETLLAKAYWNSTRYDQSNDD
jgi:hypothetical protein